MLAFRLNVRPQERRDVVAAFVTLFGIMAGHALLETARDALFLAGLPSSHLPWVYLAIAVIVILTSQLQLGGRAPSRGAATLSGWLIAGSLGTLGFWALLPSEHSALLYAIYIWAGVLVTLLLARCWSLLSDMFTVTQAKRLFGTIGAGGVLGAVVGSGIARILAGRFDVSSLLLASAIAYALAAMAPSLLRIPAMLEAPGESAGPLACTTAAARFIWSQPYTRRLVALVLVSSFTVTLVDYLFKSAAASSVPPERMAAFFASVYLTLNALSLFAQIYLVGWLIPRLGVNRALMVLPVALAAGSLGLLLGGGILFAVALKGSDGSLRYSLNRTAIEILHVPLSGELRLRIKSFIEAVGQRGGQALAAVVLLATVALAWAGSLLGVVVIVMSLVWIALAHGIRRHYLDVFRAALHDAPTRARALFAEFDLSSLESLIAALNSPEDARVLAAMELLAHEDRVRLIPALILYHPSPEVVTHALHLLAKSGRKDFVPIADRVLQDHPSVDVRAEALRARSAVEPSVSLLESKLRDPSPAIRATALVGLIAEGAGTPERLAAVRELTSDGDKPALLSLAHAIRHRPVPELDEALLLLSNSPDPAVKLEVVRAMREAKRMVFLPKLVDALAHRDSRADAGAALVALGPPALEQLAAAFRRSDLPRPVRRHLPRTLRLFEPNAAAKILLAQLLVEPVGVVRYKILRALGRLRADHPNLALDGDILARATELTLVAAYRVMAWRLGLDRDRDRHPERQTAVHGLLVTFLRDKEFHAVERLFRLLGLQYPREAFKRIHDGARSQDPAVRSGARELLENLLEPPLRAPIIALVDDLDEYQKLDLAGAYAETIPRSFAETIEVLLSQESAALRALAAYHLGELSSDSDRPAPSQVAPRDEPSFQLASVLDRALANPGPA